MSLLSRYLDGAYIAWLSSATACCGPQLEDTHVRGVEKPMTILHHQPRLIPPPVPETEHSRSSSHEWMFRTKSFASRASVRGSFSVRRKINAYNGPRRPHIGAPTDFRHVQNATPRRTDRFRPLELSIYMPENRLSPLLPHFGDIDDETDSILSYPVPALVHSRSESGLSNFGVPRKPLNAHKSVHGRLEGLSIHTTSSSLASALASHPIHPRNSLLESPSEQELMAALQDELPQVLPRARLRSNTGPPRIINRESAQIDRVKQVLQEKMELEKRLQDLDSILEERRSVYLSSRANSIYAVSQDPMPELKVSELEHRPRPKTAPAKPIVHIPVRATSFTEASATFSAIEKEQLPPPPPLPLVLQSTRPPLRKKKSFSRVSSWLFPGEHTRNISLDSVTNTPKPVTSREGFYQCIDSNPRRPSVSTVSTLESTIDEPTATTIWSANSSPNGHDQKGDLELTEIERFGDKEEGIILTTGFGTMNMPIRMSRVGVAF